MTMTEYNLREHILPTSEDYGFGMDGYWLWCGSAIKGEDGLYHMFSARWSKERPFFTGYVTSSEIVHGVSERPEGPYTFREVVLGDRGEEYWDGRMTHNPSIVKCRDIDGSDVYALFYIGSTYRGERPSGEVLYSGERPPCIDECYGNIRIGVAFAKSLNGPWERSDKPIFVPDPNGWDSTVVTNPAPCVCPDGSVLLYYRSNTPEGLKLGVAKADNVRGGYRRMLTTHLFAKYDSVILEDQFAWYTGDHYEMIAKDMNGLTCGEKFGGAHFVSPDGIHWDYAADRHAYTRLVKFTDGTEREVYHLERPNITFIDGGEHGRIPAFFSAAYGKDGGKKQPGGGSFDVMSMSKTIVIPLDTKNL